ncbi:MAG: sigma 54-interacting transcriptional regulator [Emergencia sp.]|nr:sigma 54-interacting transcriptional regulator [Emergencia sp.]
MKKVAIFYRDRKNQNAILYIQNNLYSVLGDYIDINNYYLNEMAENQIIQADAYLVLYEEMLHYLVQHISDFSKVVVISRSIQKKYLKPIMEIAKGTDVLVVNDSRESILQTVYMIYELGIGHLNLLPYDSTLKEKGAYSHIQTSIVATGSEHLIPSHIKNIYNIRNREISFETFQKLISILALENPVVQSNLIHKIKDDIDTGLNFRNSYLGSVLKNQLLTDVIENYSQAILLLDNHKQIHYINEKGYEIFHQISGEDFNTSSVFSEALFSGEDFKDELMFFNHENYLVEKRSLVLLDEVVGYCLILQNEKDLRDTEVNLNQQLKNRGLYAKYTFHDIIHESDSMKQCIDIAKKVSASDYTILIRGESGTGKELLAQSIHNYSLRKNSPFVAVNCAALPESLLESELFGYEAGAFTGAQKNGKVGLFEHAQHGTIFLDEIGDISPMLQARLLRVIQERQIMRVGSDKIINVDVRIIAATNVNLEKKILEGNFRSDLFYRLNVIALNISPLRDRKEDILPLLKMFLGKTYANISAKERKILLDYNWPGNIRELENIASYYRILFAIPDYIYSTSNQLLTEQISMPNANPKANLPYEEDALKLLILNIIANSSEALHGIGRSALLHKLTERDVNIGEGKLRKILAEFQQDGLLKVNVGRSGSQITSKGMEYLLKHHPEQR